MARLTFGRPCPTYPWSEVLVGVALCVGALIALAAACGVLP